MKHHNPNAGRGVDPGILKSADEYAAAPLTSTGTADMRKDTDDMLKQANSLTFGLASYAFTHDAKTATKVADGLDAGMVTINHQGLALPEMPFGGVKDSGYGHEGGAEGLQVYLAQKIVSQLG